MARVGVKEIDKYIGGDMSEITKAFENIGKEIRKSSGKEITKEEYEEKVQKVLKSIYELIDRSRELANKDNAYWYILDRVEGDLDEYMNTLNKMIAEEDEVLAEAELIIRARKDNWQTTKENKNDEQSGNK